MIGNSPEVSRLGLVPNNHVLVIGKSSSSSPHHMQDRHTHGLGINARKLVVVTLDIHQILN